MARINFEDDVEAQDEFWQLLPLVDNDRDRALGVLLRFFRIAQRAYGLDQPMTREELERRGFASMIESGWAESVEGGYHALGAEKHFGWYRAKVGAASAGGRARSAATRDEHGRYTLVQPAPATSQPDPATPSPLSLAPAPALAPVQKQERESSKNFGLDVSEVKRCAEVWRQTLSHFKMDRDLIAYEEVSIGRAIKLYGYIPVRLALIGARHEKKDENFDPSRFVQISRYLEAKNFQRFLNLGTEAERKRENLVKRTPGPEPGPEEYVQDAERIQAITKGLFK